MLENVARLLAAGGAGQVPITMIRQIDRGRFVAEGGVIDSEFVVVVEHVNYRRLQFAGIVLFTVQTEISQFDSDGIVIARVVLPGLPDNVVVADLAAVQVVRRVIGSQCVYFAVDGELAERDAIGVPADDCAEVRMTGGKGRIFWRESRT